MTNQSLKNKKIIIAAGASGIGWATAKTCISRGAEVFICDINDRLINKHCLGPLEAYFHILYIFYHLYWIQDYGECHKLEDWF